MLLPEPLRELNLMTPEYHRTNIELELSKNNVRSLPPLPRSKHGFERTDRTQRFQPNAQAGR